MARQYEKGIYCLNIQGSNGQEIYHLGGDDCHDGFAGQRAEKRYS